MSVLSFGTMTVGGRDRFQHMGNLGVAEASRMLDICAEAGVTVIDTADMYSFGGVGGVPRRGAAGQAQQFVLVTKVFMRVGKGAHDIGLSRKHIIESCEGSLRRLRTDYLDVYMCHEPDQFVPVEETLRAFDDLVSQGKVRYIACSNHSAWHVMKALCGVRSPRASRATSRSRSITRCVARDVEHEMVPMGLDQGVGVMAWSPLHFGLLSRQVPARRASVGDAPQSARCAGDGRSRAALPDRRRAVDDRAAARRLRRAGRAELGHEQARRRHA